MDIEPSSAAAVPQTNAEPLAAPTGVGGRHDGGNHYPDQRFSQASERPDVPSSAPPNPNSKTNLGKPNPPPPEPKHRPPPPEPRRRPPPPGPKYNPHMPAVRYHDNSEYRLFCRVEDDSDEESEKADVEDPNWFWPVYHQVQDQFGSTVYYKCNYKTVGPDHDDGNPFQVVYRKALGMYVHSSDEVQIKLTSSHLIKILSKYLSSTKGPMCMQYLENLDVEGKQVYLVLDELKKHQFNDDESSTRSKDVSKGVNKEEQGIHQDEKISTKSESSGMGWKGGTTNANHEGSGVQTVDKGRLHFKHLLRFMEEEYKNVSRTHRRMQEEKRVSWDMLWAFLTPGRKVVYKCELTQELLCAKILKTSYQSTQWGHIFSVPLNVWNYNGDIFRKCQAFRNIPYFSGESFFDSLAVWPIEMNRSTSAQVLEDQLMAKGRKFHELAIQSKTRFMHYGGPIFLVKSSQVVKEKADGRVMIDLQSFARIKPNYPMGSSKPPASYGLSERFRTPPPPPPKEPPRRRPELTFSIPDDAPSVNVGTLQITDHNLLFAPAIVYGFSFTLKQWGVFAITGFSDISFDEHAFDALVMEPELKGLLYNLVSQHIGSPAGSRYNSVHDAPSGVFPMANKGEGCIFLCYGTSGTGKTLTAESIAENMRRPLWVLSISELATDPGDLETTLVPILEIAAIWRAVLLVDDADAYLEKRTESGDINRNAMTGVFMRLLESFRGVVFLTTNRITTFDDAFRSRISLFLHFPKLNEEQRLQIWRASLEKATRLQQAGDGDGDGDGVDVKVSAEFLADMAREEMNGREIRNAIHTAQTLASSRNEKLQEKHLRFVMKVLTRSSDTLNGFLRNHTDHADHAPKSRTSRLHL